MRTKLKNSINEVLPSDSHREEESSPLPLTELGMDILENRVLNSKGISTSWREGQCSKTEPELPRGRVEQGSGLGTIVLFA